jgi:hypothetical protein
MEHGVFSWNALKKKKEGPALYRAVFCVFVWARVPTHATASPFTGLVFSPHSLLFFPLISSINQR